MKKLFPNTEFYHRTKPLTIHRSQSYERIECGIDIPMVPDQSIMQAITLSVTTHDWPIRVTISSDYGSPNDPISVNLFLDDELLLAINDAYLRLREHYSDGASSYE